MKGNKLVIAVILALIVCLVLIPTCAFADGEGEPSDNLVAGTSTTGGDDPSGTPDGGNDSGAGSGSADANLSGSGLDSGNGGSDASDSGASGESGNVNPGENDEDKNLSESGDKEEGNTTSGGNGEGADAPKPGDNGEGGEQPASGDKEEPEEKEPEASGEENEDAKLEEGSDPGAESGGEEDTPASGAESSTADAALLTAPARAPANTEGTLQSEINKPGETQITIKLGQDVKESIIIRENLNIILDLNGFTLTNTDSNNTILNKGTLTIIDSSVGKTGKVINNSGLAALVNEGTANLEGGTFTHGGESSTQYVIRNYGEMTIGGDVKVISNVGHVENSCVIDNGWINKTGTSSADGSDAVEHTGSKEAKLTINGGTFSGAGYNVRNGFWGNLTINGGTFVESAYAAVFNKNVAEINGGSFTGGYQGAVIQNDYYGDHGKGEMTITNGEFTTAPDVRYKIIWNNDYLSRYTDSLKGRGGEITVSGGRFTGTLNSKEMTYDVIYTGGIYSDKEIENLVDEDYVVVEANGWYAVNESGYDIAKDGDTVTVIKAPAETEIDDVPGGVTVKNGTDNSIFINGVEVKPGESYTVPKPAASAGAGDVLYAKYFVIEGKEQQWTAGDIEFVLNSNAVIKVLIDGVEVEFTVAEDGTVTIAAEIIEALSDGEHEIKFIFADGSCKTTFTR